MLRFHVNHVSLLTVLVCVAASSSSSPLSGNSSTLIGYISHDRFYPILTSDDRTVTSIADSIDVSLPALVFPVRSFAEEVGVRLGRERTYRERKGPDHDVRYAPVLTRGYRSPFFADQETEPLEHAGALADEFLAFLAGDPWGSQFFADGTNNTGLRVHGASDIDHDGLAEIWASYEVDHGGEGVMIYERVDAAWTPLANVCAGCD